MPHTNGLGGTDALWSSMEPYDAIMEMLWRPMELPSTLRTPVKTEPYETLWGLYRAPVDTEEQCGTAWIPTEPHGVLWTPKDALRHKLLESPIRDCGSHPHEYLMKAPP